MNHSTAFTLYRELGNTQTNQKSPYWVVTDHTRPTKVEQEVVLLFPVFSMCRSVSIYSCENESHMTPNINSKDTKKIQDIPGNSTVLPGCIKSIQQIQL